MSRAINTITAATAADGATNLNIDSGTLFIDTTNNNVGIGTASPTAQVTIGKVVDSATIPSTPANNSISLYPPTTTGYYGGGIGWSTGVNTAANICAVDGGGSGALGLVLSTGNNSAITERLRVDASGNVGIGVTSPSVKLDVSNGNIQGKEIFLQNGAASSPALGTTPSWYSPASGVAALSTNAVERLRINASGSLLIGTTSDTSGGLIKLRISDGTIDSAYGYKTGGVEYVGTITNHPIAVLTNNAERLRIDSSGNVGIGTTSPTIISSSSKILDIVGNFSGGVRFERTNSTNPSYGYLAALSGYVGLNVQSNSAFLIFTNDTERFRIDSIGNVGIGTPSPDALLHVVNNQNGTPAAPQFRISGAASVYEALHYLDATAYYIAQNSGSRELRVYSGTNAALGVKLTVGATSWASISDSRSKDIIEPITNSLDKIQNINPVIGKYKNDELNTRRSFVIGQDVQEVFPESISVDSEGYISVRYSDLIPLLIGGIKELKSENDSLKSRIEALEAA